MTANTFLKKTKQQQACRIFFLAGMLFLLALTCKSQQLFYNFRHLTTADGLSNAVVRGFAEDKYGYIWIGSFNGLSRYNGYDVKVFKHAAKDPSSIPDNLVLGLINDTEGNIRLLFSTGIYRYDFSSGRFISEAAATGLQVREMADGGKDMIWLSTNKGLAFFRPSEKVFHFVVKEASAGVAKMLPASPACLCVHGEKIYMPVKDGIAIYWPAKKEISIMPLPAATGIIEKIAVDHGDNCWISCGENGGDMIRVSKTGLITTFPGFSKNVRNNHIFSVYCDIDDRIWVSTSEKGLAQYNKEKNDFDFFSNDALQPQTISSHNTTNIFRDHSGFIWVGTEGYGVNFFNPDQHLFHTVPPTDQRNASDNWSRAVAEDGQGNYWFGSVNGVSKYDPVKKSYSLLQNNMLTPQRIYSNSVRALYVDENNFLWIGTSSGLNRYNEKTGAMLFYGKNGQPPPSFYKCITGDHNKQIWIGCRDGLYRYSLQADTFTHFDRDPLFARVNHFNTTAIFEDSRQRIWFGFFTFGVMMYDPVGGTLKQMFTDSLTNSLSKNVRSFTEDKSGRVWIGGSEGIAWTNMHSGKTGLLNEEEGLATGNTGGLLADKRDRLWIGTGKGLFMLDSARKYFKSFTLNDGIGTQEFNEQQAYKTADGIFIYPGFKGFLFFRPEDYTETAKKSSVFISSFKIFNNEYNGGTNPEELKNISLTYKQNFFSFELTAINYADPAEVIYAHKLDPFDKDWIYSKDRTVNYTNVPGGDYTFRFKAATDKSFDVPEKTFQLHIGTVFYKTIWFWLIVAILTGLLLHSIYRYRVRQKIKIWSLQNKARDLEKEKAVVQYESLKQQLNPHFLFNSLTSLRSLIRIDKNNAAEFLDQLSLNYRYILKNSDSELVDLRDELQFARTYVDLQQTRFRTGLQVTIKVPEAVQYKRIVPVTIQNLVENAVKHNLVDEESPLRIQIFEKDNYLVIQNNLQLKTFVETSNKYGLKHLQSLYRFLDTRPIIIESRDGLFTIKIPLI